MSARDRLDAIKARLEATTPGPWEMGPVRAAPLGAPFLYADVEPAVAVSLDPPDADFIAHTPTDLAALHAALEAVLALHERVQDGMGGPDHAGTWRPTFACGSCSTEDIRIAYPCPTVAAVETALDPKEEA